jgi:hypothetical protein
MVVVAVRVEITKAAVAGSGGRVGLTKVVARVGRLALGFTAKGGAEGELAA